MSNYYVFSDETGHWKDTEYIRSWLIISEKECLKLQNKIKLLKQINSIEGELKYGRGYDCSIFEDLEFEVYFTITFCEDFQNRSFTLINHLNSRESELFTIKSKNIKDKILNTIKNSIFLNIYEYYHIENALKFFKEKYPSENIVFFVDNPQYQNRDWKNIFSEAGGQGFILKIVNRSEDFEGIQFADILAKTGKVILEKIRRESQLNSFEKIILSKFSLYNGTGREYLNNPNIIMWDEKYREFVNKLNKRVNEIQNEKN